MGEEKRKKDLGIQTVVVEIRGDVQAGKISNMGVSCKQTGNWLMVLAMMTTGMDMALTEHIKQIQAANQSRIAKPTDMDIAMARGGKLPGGP